MISPPPSRRETTWRPKTIQGPATIWPTNHRTSPRIPKITTTKTSSASSRGSILVPRLRPYDPGLLRSAGPGGHGISVETVRRADLVRSAGPARALREGDIHHQGK